MAEEILVKEALTPEMIAGGEALTHAMELEGWPMVASYWLYDLESNSWRLVFSSPAVEEKGPLPALELVLKVSKRTSGAVPLENVWVMSSKDRTVRALRALASRGHNLEGRRLRTAIEGHWIEDAYVYRAIPATAA